MKTVSIHEAKTHLSRLIDRAAHGESFIIARAGKPLVKVVPVDAPAKPRRLGFLQGEIEVPDDFDRIGKREIAALFGITEVPVTGEHAVAIDTLPPFHKNPFDRLLLAQAVVERFTLITADAQLARYDGPVQKV